MTAMRLFIPITTYHAFLSFALAAEGDGENVLICNGDPHVVTTLETFAKVFPDVRFRVVVLESTYRVGNFCVYPIRKRNLKVIREVVETSDGISDIYYFAEHHVYTTYAFHVVRELFPAAKSHFSEDGVVTYLRTALRPKSAVERAMDSLFYGRWHVSLRVPGSLDPNAQVDVLYPDLLPKVYDSHAVRRVSASALRAKFRADGLSGLVDVDALAGVSSLVALDRSGTDYFDAYLDAVRSVVSGTHSGLKRHPGDFHNEALGEQLKSIEGVELPASLPIEVYYILFGERLKRVIGGLGTSTLTAKWLLPDVEATVVVPGSAVRDLPDWEPTRELFARAGVGIRLV